MNCPYCGFHFKALLATGAVIPEIAPALCENCTQVSLIESGVIRKLTFDELQEIKSSPAWRILGPVQDAIIEYKRKGSMPNVEIDPKANE